MRRSTKHRTGVGIGVLAVASGLGAILGSLPHDPPAAPLPPHGFTVADGAKNLPAPASVKADGGPGPGPARVAIPSLGIDAPWVSEAIEQHSLGIPADVRYVGIWDASDRLEATSGNVVVAGHVNYYNQGPGALDPLSGIEPGALVYLSSATTETVWKVISLQVFTKGALPSTTFATAGPRRLKLVTCGGPYDPKNGSYLDNVVATAEPVAYGGTL